MTIYISIPITGVPLEEAKARAAKVKAEILRDQPNNKVITPFDVCDDPDLSYAEHMGRDITALLGCDAIHMCDGWIGSKGCRLEYDAAKIYGLKIYT